jgi:predicted NAD/FAD-binding protein
MTAPHAVVIGAGASGLAAAWRLSARGPVTLVEADGRLGGHAWTWTVRDGPDAGLPLDLGFMVLNDRTYPRMHALLRELGIAVASTEMSFGFHEDASGFGYAINGAATLASVGASADARFGRLLKDLLRFQRRAVADLDEERLGDLTLGEYLCNTSGAVTDDYLAPMGAAIWSTAPADLKEYPAAAFLSFFRHHGLLTLDEPPQWQHVPGGAQTYVEALVRGAPHLRIIHARAAALARTDRGVHLHLEDGTTVAADLAVVAVPADQALALLEEPAPEERTALSPWRYQINHAALHSDAEVMPALRARWASWNARRTSRGLMFTYYLNRLQNHHDAGHYFLTLSPDAALFDLITPACVHLRTVFRHPVFTGKARTALAALDAAGCVRRRTFFCGSYFGYGFHEDAISAGFAAAALAA